MRSSAMAPTDGRAVTLVERRKTMMARGVVLKSMVLIVFEWENVRARKLLRSRWWL